MTRNETGEYHAEDAGRYDRHAAERGWHGHEILFGLMYEYIHPGEKLLDIGIGTGLSSLLFHGAGLLITGFDSSREMLKQCESKGIASKLLQHDLRRVPYPFSADTFTHVISLAVLNFFADPSPVFEEAARIIKPKGIFGFTVEDKKPGQEGAYVFSIHEDSKGKNEESKVNLYRHSDECIKELLAKNHFVKLKSFVFLADSYPEQEIDIYFKLYIVQKLKCD
ncbi:MAG: class I SAM-dependent DNA methyltransferase [Planctomycetota bacterium]